MTSTLTSSRYAVVALAVVTAVAGCALTGQAGTDQPADQLSFRFERIAGQGYMDQTLTIVNEAPQSVVINAEIEAVDASGDVLPDVQVESVYGSTEATMVIASGVNIDVLIFDGPASAVVADVRVTQIDATAVEASAWPTPVEAVPLDADGVPLDYPAGFSAVALRNANDESTHVRVVAIVWNNPEPSQPQQALAVIELSPLVSVPPGDGVVIDVDRAAQDAISAYAQTNAVTVKAYYSV